MGKTHDVTSFHLPRSVRLDLRASASSADRFLSSNHPGLLRVLSLLSGRCFFSTGWDSLNPARREGVASC
jgi:hypothetical protein